MNTTVAIDLAKNVFELAAADAEGNIVERKRLSRAQLQRFFENRTPARVVLARLARPFRRADTAPRAG